MHQDLHAMKPRVLQLSVWEGLIMNTVFGSKVASMMVLHWGGGGAK